MKTKLLTSLAVLLVCGFGKIVFADHHEKDEDMNKLIFPEKYTTISVSDGGKITGVVKFNGEIPEKKKLELLRTKRFVVLKISLMNPLSSVKEMY